MSKASPLPIQIMRDNSRQDIWMQQNEQYNKVPNILQDDMTYYRNKSPSFDFNLHNDQICYISEVVIDPSEPCPGDTDIFTSDDKNKWIKVEYTVNKEKTKHFVLKGEQFARYLRIHFINNDRKGNFVGIRFVKIRGTRQDHILN